MHVVFIGVDKRMIRFWIKGKKPVRIPQEKLNSLDLSIKNVRKYFPSDFSSLPRSIIEFKYWKATELRSFFIVYRTISFKRYPKKFSILSFYVIAYFFATFHDT